ncbi:hypothetical protein [Mesorhizobium sp. M0898]|uniref:hypothetical protein n=1 Tax=Mesorhizobium sp. M0898 TaxID=2957020 RepID=UPI0033364CE4
MHIFICFYRLRLLRLPWIAAGLLAGSLMIGSNDAVAQTDIGASFRVTGLSAEDTLKVRLSPAPDAKILWELGPGQRRVVSTGRISHNGASKWMEIVSSWGDETGWVNAGFLTLDGLPATTDALFDAGISLKYAADFDQPRFSTAKKSQANRCPSYIPNLVDVAVSDQMLAHFKQRGFSLATLCLAITTPMTIDLATGIDLPWLALSKSAAYSEWVVLLNVPDCFRNGTPLLDCPVNFDWYWPTLPGDSDPTSYRSDGELIDERVKKFMAQRSISNVVIDSQEYDEKFGEAFFGKELQHIDFVAVSKSFIRGYAYRLHTNHDAGDGLTAAELEAAMTPSLRRAQIDAASLGQAWSDAVARAPLSQSPTGTK